MTKQNLLDAVLNKCTFNRLKKVAIKKRIEFGYSQVDLNLESDEAQVEADILENLQCIATATDAGTIDSIFNKHKELFQKKNAIAEYRASMEDLRARLAAEFEDEE